MGEVIQFPTRVESGANAPEITVGISGGALPEVMTVINKARGFFVMLLTKRSRGATLR